MEGQGVRCQKGQSGLHAAFALAAARICPPAWAGPPCQSVTTPARSLNDRNGRADVIAVQAGFYNKVDMPPPPAAHRRSNPCRSGSACLALRHALKRRVPPFRCQFRERWKTGWHRAGSRVGAGAGGGACNGGRSMRAAQISRQPKPADKAFTGIGLVDNAKKRAIQITYCDQHAPGRCAADIGAGCHRSGPAPIAGRWCRFSCRVTFAQTCIFRALSICRILAHRGFARRGRPVLTGLDPEGDVQLMLSYRSAPA